MLKPDHFKPLPESRRALTFVAHPEGTVCEIDTETRCMNCPTCGLRFMVDPQTLADMQPPCFRVSWQCPQQWGCGRAFYVTDRDVV